ncbi:MAG: formyltransferase family protein [Pirellula sp.]|jgi:methionyl-tRNA formyltransferase
MKNIVLLTGSELRHQYVRRALAANPNLRMLTAFCEGAQQSLAARLSRAEEDNTEQQLYAATREQTERDIFGLALKYMPEASNPKFLEKGQVNTPEVVNSIVCLNPDILCAYGCSLIKSELLTRFEGRFINLHLGLSPYFRGSGTNYFPLVQGRPEYVGATFMFLDRGIDTGRIIHQIRARIYHGDSAHLIGNRLIADAAEIYSRLVAEFDRVVDLPQPSSDIPFQLCLRKDFTLDSLRHLQHQFDTGMIEKYLNNENARCKEVPLIQQPWLTAQSKTT